MIFSMDPLNLASLKKHRNLSIVEPGLVNGP